MITVRERLIAFFLANPEEQLTQADMCERWGALPGNVRDILTRMMADGLVHAGNEDRTPWKHGPKPRHYWPAPGLFRLHESA